MRLVEVSAGDDGWHFLTVRSGATTPELVAGVAALPASILVDALSMDRAGSGVVMTFRDFPPGVVIDSAPWPGQTAPEDPADAITAAPVEGSGWVPEVGQAVGPDRGLTPFEQAVWELVSAARDGAAAAWIAVLIRRVPPQGVVALADLALGRHCGCRNGGRHS
ncbi:hypothetical protein [Pseudofrankia inefficax]|uniref:hypothetical protein n=1 Tax=Pseudofrankia inefficax (strain DSM 45817 / CECT 9037 / DDB 130130 / EuI1c) TaxID=298654 RepID=UPI0003142955|nr:hypothetical protein [Pseudofrankia inefficax]